MGDYNKKDEIDLNLNFISLDRFLNWLNGF